MNRTLVFCLLLILKIDGFSQVGIGTSSPDASAKLDVTSTTKGVLLPRLTNAQMLAISSPATGLIVYNTNAGANYIFNGSTWNSLENRISAIVNDGVDVQLDNIKVRMSTVTNERSVQISTVSGTITVSGGSITLLPTNISISGLGVITSWIRQSNSLGTTPKAFIVGGHFAAHGSVQKIEFFDETNKKSYRCIMIVGNSWKNNFICLERVL